MTDKKFLLCETEKIDKTLKGDDGNLYLYGPVQTCKLNQNGRVYPKDILTREVKNYQSIIEGGRSYLELDHPPESEVKLANVAGMLKEIWWGGALKSGMQKENEDSETVYGKVLVLDTPNGKIVKSLVENGGKVGISSRGVGSLVEERDGINRVDDDYQLICFDIVSDPSVSIAVMQELREVKDANAFRQKFSRADRIYRILNKIV